MQSPHAKVIINLSKFTTFFPLDSHKFKNFFLRRICFFKNDIYVVAQINVSFLRRFHHSFFALSPSFKSVAEEKS